MINRFLAIVLILASCSGFLFSFEKLSSIENESINWKAVIMSADNSIVAFDNVRKKVKELFIGFGLEKSNIIELSKTEKEQVNGVRPASIANLEQAFKDLNVKNGEGCVLYLTSHGSSKGFFVLGEKDPLTPTKLNQILTDSCGENPSIIIVSACYSGVFTSSVMVKPNRIILTAARDDRPSFGCGIKDIYPFWDECFIDHFSQSLTWEELSEKITKCIDNKETDLGYNHSFPQTKIGEKLKNWLVFPRPSEKKQ